GVPFLRPAGAGEAVDRLDAAPMPIAGQPAEYLLDRGERSRLGMLEPELDERHEAPVRALPLLVRMTARIGVEQRPHDRAVGKLGIDLLAEQIPACEARDRRLGRGEQPLDRLVHAYFPLRSISSMR